MVTSPEEELGLAMKRFIGSVLGYSEIWKEAEGDYVLRVLEPKDLEISAAIGQQSAPITGVVVTPIRDQSRTEGSFVVLSISPGEGIEYGVARERYYFANDDSSAKEETEGSVVDMLDRNGVCLPIGRHDLLIMIRDFLFSHMYVLRRETFGFAGTMIMPSAYEFFAVVIPSGVRQSQYNVVLERLPRNEDNHTAHP